jgi:hypothetical protein
MTTIDVDLSADRALSSPLLMISVKTLRRIDLRFDAVKDDDVRPCPHFLMRQWRWPCRLRLQDLLVLGLLYTLFIFAAVRV